MSAHDVFFVQSREERNALYFLAPRKIATREA